MRAVDAQCVASTRAVVSQFWSCKTTRIRNVSGDEGQHLACCASRYKSHYSMRCIENNENKVQSLAQIYKTSFFVHLRVRTRDPRISSMDSKGQSVTYFLASTFIALHIDSLRHKAHISFCPAYESTRRLYQYGSIS